ncbi:hypothetical protein [Streptomyces paromomycinus]|uniref:Uncharacterized protein n=1 Tax=Streptomyces paromomycinus TaxID=92743 RepID=A0A401W0I0_STREY|nr:hypothetical protein [Streptomyces paromomycinus]GCD42796.1 hypothetical protein GKJPGBOP_02470 [Streptomyces paromomycinus]
MGSEPLPAHGIRPDIGDLDVVARGAAWKRAAGLGDPVPAPLGYVDHVLFFSGDIEVLNGWFEYDVDELIEEADVFCGLNFSPLIRVLEWKTQLARKKDRADIEAIHRYLRTHP